MGIRHVNSYPFGYGLIYSHTGMNKSSAFGGAIRPAATSLPRKRKHPALAAPGAENRMRECVYFVAAS
jgi:hypothetical protein